MIILDIIYNFHIIKTLILYFINLWLLINNFSLFLVSILNYISTLQITELVAFHRYPNCNPSYITQQCNDSSYLNNTISHHYDIQALSHIQKYFENDFDNIPDIPYPCNKKLSVELLSQVRRYAYQY